MSCATRLAGSLLGPRGLFISRLLARLCSSPCPCSSAKPTAAAPSAAQRVSQPATAAAAASEAACASWTWGPVAPSARRYPGVSTVCLSCRDSPYSSSSSSGSSDSGSDSISRSTLSVLGGVRGYRTRINWMRVRFRARVSLFVKQGLKPKNHSKVLTRFRLTRFGWQRLRRGRNGVKFNLTHKQFKKKYSIAYVSRHDLKKFKYQTPGYKLRIRDPPIDTNPNIQSIRKLLPAHFG